jgi:hypothetical protein
MTVERFNPSSTHPLRAAQAWQILVGMAMNRQTVTYLRLSNLMYGGRDAPGVLSGILGHIAYFCDENRLPQLNVIVVGGDSGIPGDLIPLDPSVRDQMREAVYREVWYDIVPPSSQELADATERRRKKASRK